MTQNTLGVWTDGRERYIANSIEEAMEMQMDRIGENPMSTDGWTEMDQKTYLVIEDDVTIDERTVHDWILQCGRGFLCVRPESIL